MLELKALRSGYGETVIVRDVSLSVPEGELVAVLGSNGVGKSTLLKTIMGEITAVSGEILWDGVPLRGQPIWRRPELGVGYVPQGREIFPFLSVHENLTLGLEAIGVGGRSLRREAEAMYEYFPILKPLRRRRGGDLSGGQQQILALARVLIKKPRLLILDEPSEGIQPSIVSQINDALGNIKRGGVSILLVEQYPDFALTYADRYFLMERGEFVGGGAVTDANRAATREAIHI